MKTFFHIGLKHGIAYGVAEALAWDRLPSL